MSRGYHSVDIRPQDGSEEMTGGHGMYQQEAHGSRTHLAQTDQYNVSVPRPTYPPERQGGLGASTASLGKPYNTPSPAFVMPMPAHNDSNHQFQKLNEKEGKGSRNSSTWDLFGGKKFSEGEWADYDTRNATEAHLKFAEGDFAKTGLGKFYAYLLNLSIITRWTLYIIPIAAILWIPGIVGLTASPNGRIWGVKLIWWSIWFTVAWVGWWAALAFAMVLPKVLRWTVGVAVVSLRHYIDWLTALCRYIALTAWSIAIWVSFQPLIDNRQASDTSDRSKEAVDLIAKILFAIVIASGVLLAEKFAIQFIAYKFHQRSYEDRIQEQKAQTKCLIMLYSHSSDIPDRNDTLKDGDAARGASKALNPKKFFKNVLKGVRGAAEGATTVFGNVASEIVGTSTLQPNSPEAKVNTALQSANKTRMLARRIYYSFRKQGASVLVFDDVSRYFPNADQAQYAFHMFDKDDNGDATREEIELSCLEIHRERLSLAASMKDIDSAVGRLDNILMSLYLIVVGLIVAVSLDASFTNLLTAAGTLLLGLSWLIGSSASEVLLSIIFILIKHPYDISDTIVIDKDTYVVKEIRLLSTILVDGHGCFVQYPNSLLNSMPIRNHRRSGAETETFEFDVTYDTAFEKLENLRALMLAFVESRRRDFLPVFDVEVVDIPGQEKMTLKADIRYKSNSQVASIKAKRRNLWICALKKALKDTHIFGPGGDPDAPSGPSKYTLVPWDEVKPKDSPQPTPGVGGFKMAEPLIPKAEYSLTDKNAYMMDQGAMNVFGEDEMPQTMSPYSTLPPMSAPSDTLRQRPNLSSNPSGHSDSYEMQGHRI